MKRLSSLMALLLTVTVMCAQGIAFEPEGTLLYEAAMKAKKENKLVILLSILMFFIRYMI